MRKIYLGIATLLLSGSIAMGSDTDDSNYNPFKNSEQSASTHVLTPKRTKSFVPIKGNVIKQASLTAQFEEISSDSPFDNAPAVPAPPVLEEPTAPQYVPPPADPAQPAEQQQDIPSPVVEQFDHPYIPPQPEPPVAEPPVIEPVVVEQPVVEQPVVEPPAVVEPVPQIPVVQEVPAVKVPVIQVPQTMPDVEPAPTHDTYSFVYAELEQFRNELEQFKKNNAKPDPKKGWSAPKFSGRIFLDSVNFMDSDRNGFEADRENAAGFRELRLGMAGTGYDSFDYKIEFGFHTNNGSATLMDNWVGVKNLPLLGYFRVGYYKPEVGLYFPMGTTNVSMMEYVTPANAFGLNRRVGMSSEHLFANDRVRLFLGVFQKALAADRNVNQDDQGQIFNLRFTTVPVFEQEGKHLLHFGGHWEYVNTQSGTESLSATPGTFSWANASLNVANFANDHSHRGGLELAYQNGRFSARSELYTGSFAAYGDQQGRRMNGAYVELGLFLSDAFRIYDLKTGGFGGIKMKENFHPYANGDWNLVDSFGVWQAIFQWGYTDMTDWRDYTAFGSFGGKQTDITFGLNWFWSPQMRMIFEFVHSKQNTGVAHTRATQDIFGTSIRYNW